MSREGKDVETTCTDQSFEKFSCEVELAWRESYLNRDIVQEKLFKKTGDIRACQCANGIDPLERAKSTMQEREI